MKCPYCGFGVVQTGYDGVVQNRHALTDGLCRVIQNCGQVGILREAEARDTLVRAVHDKERPVGERRHTRHNAPRRLQNQNQNQTKKKTPAHQEQFVNRNKQVRTIRSIVHCGFGTSGCVLTQLSSATPKLEPPQTRMVSGSEYGAFCGNVTTEPSMGYVRPARKLVTEPGMFGSTFTVASVTGSSRRASL